MLELVQLSAVGLVLPEAAALRGEPERARMVFHDVDGQRAQLAYPFEGVRRVVVEVQPVHGGSPCAPVAVVQDGVDAAVIEAVLIAGAYIMAQLSADEVEHIQAVGIGAYPQLVALQGQGVDVESLKRREITKRGRVRGGSGIEAHQSAIVAGYPDVAFVVFAET